MRAQTSAAIGAATLLGLAAGTATAESITQFANQTNQIASFTTLVSNQHSQFNIQSILGSTGNNMNFTSTTGSVAANDLNNFYLGAASGLGGIWFDAGSNTPGANTTVLAFGNNQSATNSNSVTINFNPGVLGFGFTYDDVEVSTLTVTWTDGSTSDLVIDPTSGGAQEGYIAIVSADGKFVNSVTLSQTPGTANDGFSFYDFSVAVVPLPPAAWAGLALLGGVAGVRKIRRRG